MPKVYTTDIAGDAHCTVGSARSPVR